MDVPANYRPIAGSTRRPKPGARRLSAADPDERLSISIYVRERPDTPPLPDQEHWAATPPGRRTFLTRDELARQHGADPGDLDRVAAFVQEHGLQVTRTDVARGVVLAEGTVAQVSTAFATDLARYEVGETTYRGRDGEIHIPAELIGIIVGVFGLDNRQVVKRNFTPTVAQVTALYDFPTNTAAGQTIGILEFGGGFVLDSTTKRPSDVDLFFNGLGLTPPSVTAVSVDGVTNSLAGSVTNFFDQDYDV
jgi:kumamolisin